jgi:hypothetical protein
MLLTVTEKRRTVRRSSPCSGRQLHARPGLLVLIVSWKREARRGSEMGTYSGEQRRQRQGLLGLGLGRESKRERGQRDLKRSYLTGLFRPKISYLLYLENLSNSKEKSKNINKLKLTPCIPPPSHPPIHIFI